MNVSFNTSEAFKWFQYTSFNRILRKTSKEACRIRIRYCMAWRLKIERWWPRSRRWRPCETCRKLSTWCGSFSRSIRRWSLLWASRTKQRSTRVARNSTSRCYVEFAASPLEALSSDPSRSSSKPRKLWRLHLRRMQPPSRTSHQLRSRTSLSRHNRPEVQNDSEGLIIPETVAHMATALVDLGRVMVVLLVVATEAIEDTVLNSLASAVTIRAINAHCCRTTDFRHIPGNSRWIVPGHICRIIGLVTVWRKDGDRANVHSEVYWRFMHNSDIWDVAILKKT